MAPILADLVATSVERSTGQAFSEM
jgi:hypothetical protein